MFNLIINLIHKIIYYSYLYNIKLNVLFCNKKELNEKKGFNMNLYNHRHDHIFGWCRWSTSCIYYNYKVMKRLSYYGQKLRDKDIVEMLIYLYKIPNIIFPLIYNNGEILANILNGVLKYNNILTGALHRKTVHGEYINKYIHDVLNGKSPSYKNAHDIIISTIILLRNCIIPTELVLDTCANLIQDSCELYNALQFCCGTDKRNWVINQKCKKQN